MKISGKYAVFALLGTAVGLGWIARETAKSAEGVKVTEGVPTTTTDTAKPSAPKTGKHAPTTGPKSFQSFESARALAEKKMAEGLKQKSEITKYESKPEGWIFYFDAFQYLTSGNPNDKNRAVVGILVRPNGQTEFISQPDSDLIKT
jgi:hypothetical protein